MLCKGRAKPLLYSLLPNVTTRKTEFYLSQIWFWNFLLSIKAKHHGAKAWFCEGNQQKSPWSSCSAMADSIIKPSALHLKCRLHRVVWSFHSYIRLPCPGRIVAFCVVQYTDMSSNQFTTGTAKCCHNSTILFPSLGREHNIIL